MIGDLLWSTKRRQGMVETLAKQAARTVASQIGRQIQRGVLGGILGGSRCCWRDGVAVARVSVSAEAAFKYKHKRVTYAGI